MDVLHIGSVLAGLILLCIGGYAIVSGGVSLAKKLRISSMIIGLTVVAYGTSTPELAASLLAAFNSHTELILGNIVGSNISNVGMVIGISAIFTPLLISKITVSRWIPIMIGVSLLLVAMSYDGEISQVDGVILIAALIGFTAYTIKTVKKQKIQQNENIENEELEGEYFLSSDCAFFGTVALPIYGFLITGSVFFPVSKSIVLSGTNGPPALYKGKAF